MPTDTTTTSLTAGVLAGLDFDHDPACELKPPSQPTHAETSHTHRSDEEDLT